MGTDSRAATSGQTGAPSGGLRVDVVTALDDLEALRPAWQQLVDASPAATVFVTPEWVLTWYRYFRSLGGIYVVTVWDGGRLAGLAPFVRVGVGRPPAGFQLLVTAGTDHGYYGEPLLGPDPEPVAAVVAGHLAGLARRGMAAVNLRRLWTGGALHRAVTDRDDVRCHPMAPPADSAVVRFDEVSDATAYLRRVGRKHSVPRRSRRLAEAHGAVEYVPDDPDLDGALDDLVGMLRRRWGSGDGPRTFAGPRRAAFTRAAIRALAARGRAGVSTLRVDGGRAAASVVFRLGDRVYSDHAAFDPDLAAYGVGQQEMYEVLRHARETGATEVDLSAVSEFPYKLRWANSTHSSQSVTLAAPGRRRRIVAPARRAAMSYRARRLGRLEALAVTERPAGGGTEVDRKVRSADP